MAYHDDDREKEGGDLMEAAVDGVLEEKDDADDVLDLPDDEGKDE